MRYLAKLRQEWKDARRLELLSCAIARCETTLTETIRRKELVIRTDGGLRHDSPREETARNASRDEGNTIPNQVVLQEEALQVPERKELVIDRDGGAQPDLPTGNAESALDCARIEENRILRQLVPQEEALRAYLDRSNGDAIQAMALAKGDVAHHEQAKKSGMVLFATPRTFASKLVVPVLLIAVTAIAGNTVGTMLQRQSFERSRVFETRLEQLRDAQRTASSLFLTVQDLHYKIQRDEKVRDLSWRPHEVLRQYRGRLEHIRNMSIGVDRNGRIRKALDPAASSLNSFITCLEQEVPHPIRGTKGCADSFSTVHFQALQDAVSENILVFLSR